MSNDLTKNDPAAGTTAAIFNGLLRAKMSRATHFVATAGLPQ
jgi:hypothetical protein